MLTSVPPPVLPPLALTPVTVGADAVLYVKWSPDTTDDVPPAVFPGNRVDILQTTTDDTGKRKTVMLVENVLVLAINRLGSESFLLTFALKPVDAARVIKAKEKGHFSLLLRQPGDEQIVNPPPVTGLFPERDVAARTEP